MDGSFQIFQPHLLFVVIGPNNYVALKQEKGICPNRIMPSGLLVLYRQKTTSIHVWIMNAPHLFLVQIDIGIKIAVICSDMAVAGDPKKDLAIF